MKLPSFLTSFATANNPLPRSTPRKKQRTAQLGYQACEPRNLLAGIELFADTGQVLQRFNASEVQSILFVGLRGDDYFENRTSIPSIAFGQVGNDTLIGGSGADRLFGNTQDDIIDGGGGDDFLVAGIGNDVVNGGSGNDRILGIDDINTISGDAGNDTIFGATTLFMGKETTTRSEVV